MIKRVYEKVRQQIRFVYRHTIRSGDYRPRSFMFAIRAAISIY